MDTSIRYSCVVDDTPGIWSSIGPWLLTAIGLGRISPGALVVQHVCPLREDVAELCARLGVTTHPLEPFDARTPHSNKIGQLGYDFGAAERIVLMDVDMVFTRPLPVDALEAAVAGKLVDAPNPPLPVLRAIFREAKLSLPKVLAAPGVQQSGMQPFETALGNFNGGLYVIDARHRVALHRAWSKWAHWLLERIELMDRWSVHVDQVSFCLAVAELNLDAQVLGAQWNFPTHLPGYPADAEPWVLHHHCRMDAHLLLEKCDAPLAAQAIERVNAHLKSVYRDDFSNRTFWEHRYAHHPELGSGVGSRNETLALKRKLFAAIVPNDVSILDWGCGDIEVIREFPWTDYRGVDLSDQALRLAAAKRPDWKFSRPEEFLVQDGAKRDLVICLDVLIHQPNPQAYQQVLDQLLELAGTGALISGYDAAPGHASHITYFHEPLRETLLHDPRVASLIPIANYRDTQLYFVEVRRPTASPAGLPVHQTGQDAAMREAHRILAGSRKPAPEAKTAFRGVRRAMEFMHATTRGD